MESLGFLGAVCVARVDREHEESTWSEEAESRRRRRDACASLGQDDALATRQESWEVAEVEDGGMDASAPFGGAEFRKALVIAQP